MTDEAATAEVAPEPAAPESERWHDVIVERDSQFSRGQLVAHPAREQYVDFIRTLRDDDGYWLCLDVTAVDYAGFAGRRRLPDGIEPERFEVVVHVISHHDRSRVRIRLQVPDEEPVVPSLFDVHPGTEALEREVFDMFGIRFEGHPDLTRILMPEDWEGYPLRKDYSIGAIPVQFKGVRNDR
ncbi:MAG: NADH-quinone oxidoreductase subunit C [Acidimicrobiales bacterium]